MEPLIVLAPLAGYTNLAYRRFMKSFGCDIVVSEMISDFALHYNNEETFKMIETSLDESPVAIQLFGGSKESLLEGVRVLQERSNYDYLDLNLGCPVNKVIKNNSGSAWLKVEREDELFDTVKEIVKISKKPVTCKIRLGWTEEDINTIKVAKILEKAGVKLIVIHGRTRSQMYNGNATYDEIKKVKESVNIPVIANGDIFTLEKAIEVLEYTKCDGVALGRGVLGNPFLITQIKHYYKTGEKLKLPDITTQLEYLIKHYQMLIDLKGEYIATKEIRGIASWYLKGFCYVKEYKVLFSTINNADDFYGIIEKIKNDEKIVRID